MFFHFFKSWIFQVVRGVKGQKKILKWQKFLSITLHISETIHNMIFRYGTHVQSDNISRHYFHFFKILIFWVLREVKGQKTVQNDKKLCVVLHISGTMHYVIVIYGTCVKWYLQVFSSMFQKFDFPVCQGVKRQKCVLPYISGTLYHMIFIYGTHL